jgi:hypothetical protein
VDDETGDMQPDCYGINCSHPLEFEPVLEPGKWFQRVVLELGAVGEVIQVFMANGTRIERCLSKMVSKRTLPPPPLAPAYLPMSINVYIPNPEVSNEPIVRDVIKDER